MEHFTMKMAEITNLTLVKVAMERLTNRLDGLPALGVLYGPSGYGKNHSHDCGCQQYASLLCANPQCVEQENAAGKDLH
ncbi:hypothetical protein [Wielerella bovis]|uniref:hypothetical protein n=1 Tax=Wielerella bovis TaxID=2917790 RepID=UPI0020186239|nr:hypothetical protein [Wielerella bovis]MCG7655905.1 hypothetical protein [Wielerella bovis]